MNSEKQEIWARSDGYKGEMVLEMSHWITEDPVIYCCAVDKVTRDLLGEGIRKSPIHP